MKKETPIIINNVLPGSIAQEAGIEKGDILLSINGEDIKDIFDYKFLICDEEITLEIKKENGEIWEIDIEKFEDEDLGIEFVDELIDEAKSCSNKCIFCFIDQMPKGMRDSLYFKDDDMRLSFLSGNYVTLTNVDDNQIDRIIKYRMSPINISVHTTNPDLRVFMLKNRFAGSVMSKIRKLAVSGITLNCQIVLCRGINDKGELTKSIMDLAKLYPAVNSISVVPVGLTKHREGLCRLDPYDEVSSMEVIEQVEKIQEEFLKKHRSRIVYIADEFYVMAGREIPPYEYYEDFPQIENGVGLMRLFSYEVDREIEKLKDNISLKNKYIVATGTLAYEFIKSICDKVMANISGLEIKVVPIKNYFFGTTITVSGLITGQDLINQLKEYKNFDALIIPNSMLRSGEKVFLDDLTIEDIEKVLNIKVIPTKVKGKDFINIFTKNMR